MIPVAPVHPSVHDPEPEPVHSPLHDEHVALGATLTPFAGWLMPLRYTSDLAEHIAVRTAAGLFDLSHMGEIGVHGPDAARFLDLALVGTLSALRPLQARYTMICADDGGVLDDLIVYRTGDDAFLVVANAANHTRVLAELRSRRGGPDVPHSHLPGPPPAPALDVTVADESPDTALVAVQGPRSLEVVRATAGLAVPGLDELKYYAAVPGTFEGSPILVARTGYTGEDGFEFFLPAVAAPALWRAFLRSGGPFGLVPAGLAARDSLRLEAGMPLYGHELTATTTPHDAGLGRVVRLDKVDASGAPIDFVGRRALAERAATAGSRTLVGLEVQGRRAARQGYPVLTGEGPEAAVVGEVTSGAPSPTLGHPIAMASVTPEFSAPGTELAVDVRGRRERVRVVPLPFYRRPR